MKLAVLGSGPRALETALFFEKQDCSVTIFYEESESIHWFERIGAIDEMIKTSAYGRELLQITETDLQHNSYRDLYFNPLRNYFSQQQKLRDCRVSRLTKAHLSSREEINGSSRLVDLFRVTFEMDTERLIKEQQKVNEMAFNNISTDSILSLKRSIEMAEDFDVVVMAYDSYENNMPIGVGNNFCLNEKFFNIEEKFFNRGVENIIEANSIAIFGNPSKIAYGLYRLREWLKKNESNNVSLVYKGRDLRSKLTKTNSQKVNETLIEMLTELDKFHGNEKQRLEKALIEWNSLEDYEKVKYPRPSMNSPQVKFYEQMNLISIDQLDESKKFYLTLEPKKNNNKFEEFHGVSTIGVDSIVNEQIGLIEYQLFSGLKVSPHHIDERKLINESEPGFFNLSNAEQIFFDVDIFSEKLEVTFQELKKYFTKN